MAEDDEDEVTVEEVTEFLQNIKSTLVQYAKELTGYIDSLEELVDMDEGEMKEMITDLKMKKSHQKIFQQGLIDYQLRNNEVAKLLITISDTLVKYVLPLKKYGIELPEELEDLNKKELQDIAIEIRFEGKKMKKQQRRKFVEGILKWQKDKEKQLDTNKESSEEPEEKIQDDDCNRVEKGVVICIGISVYDEAEEYDDLPSVPYDIKNYEDVLGGYGYEIWSSWDKYKGKMKIGDISRFLNKCKNKLFQKDDDGDVIVDDDGVNVSIYDSIFITLSGHGTISSLVSSDGKTFPYSKIRSRFSGDGFPAMPRIFCVDACRVEEEEKNKEVRSGGNTGLSVTLMGTCEGNYVYGGKISQFLMKNFSLNHDKFRKQRNMKSFGEILEAMTNDFEQDLCDTPQRQQLILSEFDKKIEKYKFLPHPKARGKPGGQIVDNAKAQSSIYDEVRNFLVSLQMDGYVEDFEQYKKLKELKDFGKAKLKELGVSNSRDQAKIIKALKKKFP